MKKFLKYLAIVLASIVGFLLIVFLLFAIFKPWGIDIIKMYSALTSDSPSSSYDHPLLNTQQEALLEAAGIDPKDVPTQITPTQQKCAVDLIGETRVKEIIAGSQPTFSEILKIKPCFE